MELDPSGLRKDAPPVPAAKPPGTRSGSRTWVWLTVFALASAGGWYLWSNGKLATVSTAKASPPKSGKKGSGAIPVVAARARRGDIGVYITGLGSVTPIYTVTIKSRVDGQLMKIHYNEGDMVHAGDLLAEIDPRPYAATLEQAEGQMIRDQANLANAKVDLDRYTTLLAQNAIPEQQLATQKATVSQDEGIVKNDQGQIDSAKVQIVYCHITSPIGGRVGLRLVDPGNIVHVTDTTGMVVITQLQPITVIFPISEDYLPQVLARLKMGETLRVEAYDREMKQRLAVGSLLTIDNEIDPTTGTVRFKATFPNEKNELFPGQFVNARLLVDVNKGVIVVPAPALQRGPQGTFVYVVKPDRTATVRPITVSEIEEGKMAVKTGLQPGELVVVDGAERLREGTRVELKPQGTVPSPATARGP